MDAIIFAWAAIGPVVSLILAFPITIAYKDNSLVDLGWALGFMVMPWIAFILNYIRNNTWSIRQLIINVLIIIWGIRLISYIIVRRSIRKEEDKRFVAYRERWQNNFFFKSFVVLFVPQMFLVYMIGSPALFANTVNDPFIPNTIGMVMLIIGGIVWVQGFIFETVGDIQLLNFRKNPANEGKILSSGFWRYTRHPNYWGEATQWWGIFLMAIPMAFLNMNDITQIIVGCATVFGPMLLTFTLLKFSGIPTLEKEGILKGREGYKEYIETTSAFIPWFPKKKKKD